MITLRKVVGWARDLSDEAGIRYDRRLFLNHQLKIAQATTPDSLWEATCESLESLNFDCVEFNYIEQKAAPTTIAIIRQFSWKAKATCRCSVSQDFILKIDLPLQSKQNEIIYNFGKLSLMKDMHNQTYDHYLLKRIEQLRRSMLAALLKISDSRLPHKAPVDGKNLFPLYEKR
ncbi:MAG: hypothetical protein D3923_08580 [Candidatus Electrothrix sp. AR3]|nr:hypothetical protein [Candidatus Electrothrix sp. AR3]